VWRSRRERLDFTLYLEIVRYRIQKVLSSMLAVTLHLREVTVLKSILIADDSGAIRTATRHSVESQPGLEVYGEAIDGLDAVEKARTLKPDLIILDPCHASHERSPSRS
jgi:PleD family two-component response regulator